MFKSQYNHTIDAKGRLSIPSKFRDVLGDEFVITKGMDGCLFAYTNEAWEEFEQKLSTLPTLTNKNARQFVRFFMAGAASVDIDKQGRILMPNHLKTHAALEKDVVLVGAGTRIEIWSLERWESMNPDDKDMDDIAEGIESLGLSI